MEKMIRLSIQRRTPSAAQAYSQEYSVLAERPMTVLEILYQISLSQDPTLAFRAYRCGRRICRSCEVRVNGKIVRGCATLLHPGETYRLEPAHDESLIRDLVFSFER
jgi:succinate dehydrogenase/fumarate reductase-like Fe-S protein